jgi:hypothetical protein
MMMVEDEVPPLKGLGDKATIIIDFACPAWGVPGDVP